MTADAELVERARAHGIAPTYEDVHGQEQSASPEVLRALLAHLEVDDDRAEAPALDPVTVAWDGRGSLAVRRPADRPPDVVHLRYEDGAEHTLPVESVGGAWQASLSHLPTGVHEVRLGDEVGAVLSAPRVVPPRPGRGRQWGAFAPLHALRDDRRRPIGDLTTLRRFGDWAAARGADWIATLPLLPGDYEGDDVDPSPYRPLTRLAWNELHLDPARLPELEGEDVPASPADGEAVDWARVATDVHGLLARAVERLSDRRRAELEVFLAARPSLAGYVRFRGGGREHVELRHAYAQWMLHDQLDDLARALDDRGQALYLDLSLGVHPDGYDAVAHADQFATGVSVGAPPDAFFEAGQDWGFAPPHPERARLGGYPYLRACLDHHLGMARMLRLDHVMGLHRLWWIPDGADAADGAYVNYPAEEQYAVLCLAAAAHRAELIGENLGTVPPEVDAALAEHGLVGMWPLQLAPPDSTPPPGSLAVLNTHDMAPFAAWWAEQDDDRDAATALRAHLVDLATGPARHVQVSLEDLWLEERPQNQPGTGAEAGNWTRRAARSLEELDADPEIEAVLDDLEAARRTADTLAERSA